MDLFRSVTVRYAKFRAKLKLAEEKRRRANAKVKRLRKREKIWFKRKIRAIRRGIDNIKELERVEREEAVLAAALVLANPSFPDFPSLSPGWDEFGVNPDFDLFAFL